MAYLTGAGADKYPTRGLGMMRLHSYRFDSVRSQEAVQKGFPILRMDIDRYCLVPESAVLFSSWETNTVIIIPNNFDDMWRGR